MVKTKWYCDSCTKEFDGSEADTQIEFFINKHTKDAEFQGQQQYYAAIEVVGVCYECCINAMGPLGMIKPIEKIRNESTKK